MRKGRGTRGMSAALAIALVAVLLVTAFPLRVSKVGASSATIYLSNDYSMIQAPADAVAPGDVVRDGTIQTGEVDISVSDSPDPFNPLYETNTITITNEGTIPVYVTLSIDGSGRSWQWEALDPSASVEATWDGNDDGGNRVPAGTYAYTAIGYQHYSPGWEDTETGTITVAYGAPTENQLPVAKFTYYPQNPVVNEEITFDASDSYDPDGYIECYAWSFYYCDSEECFCEASSGKITTFSYSGAGDYAVKLVVFDNRQAGDSITKIITVSPAPGYAIIVAGQAPGAPGLVESQWLGHSADNAYRVLWNLGFEHEHIFYLNSQRQLWINGENVVSAPASKSSFQDALNNIKGRIGHNSTPFVLYLVGHGGNGNFFFDPQNETGESLSDVSLRHMLEDAPFDPALIAIWACDAGQFITVDTIEDSISVEGEDRIIVTGSHENDVLKFYDLARSSDRFWRNLNEGLNVKEAFVRDATEPDRLHRWLDDNGDQKGSPPDDLGKDGNLAADTVIGIPGTRELVLVPWYLAMILSPGELRVYDSHDRVTGLINGEGKQEIPGSIYDQRDGIVAIFSPSGTYRYEVVGTDEGTYELDISSIEGGKATDFTAINLPTGPGAVHQYTIDWDALSQGEKGVTLQIDADGDGVFEETITADNDLTQDEFILETETVIDLQPDTLSLKTKGRWVTAYIELPEGYDVVGIDVSTVRLEGIISAEASPTEVGDHDGDGIPDLMVKFDYQALIDYLGDTPGEVTLTVNGNVGDVPFEGSDTITVIRPGK